MSGASRKVYRETFEKSSELFSSDAGVREKAIRARGAHVAHARETVEEKRERDVRDDAAALYDKNMVKKTITRPAAGVARVHVCLIDNSGSNRAIARHMRASGGYLIEALHAVDPGSQIAFMYFSDHGDGDRMIQEVDYVSANDTGEKTLVSTTKHVVGANGFDEPEAIECALVRACELDFGDAEHKHLYLVSDVVAHGMGMEGDDGCPNQQDWRKSVRLAQGTYSSFEVIGSGKDPDVAELQTQFLIPARVGWDFIDLSSIKEVEHRQGITANALLFLIARHVGMQSVQVFLAALYQKWLADPVFGKDTDARAQDMIRRFGQYLELPSEQVETIMETVLS